MLKGSAHRLRNLLNVPDKAGVSAVLARDWIRGGRQSDAPLEEYVHAAHRWLCTAQDASPDDGVSAYYSLLQGWKASYPETTGYIIPTFLEYARRYGDEDARKRALAMADWECDVQLPTGAVRSGTMQADPAPAVFNTGQVLFGWSAAWQAAASDRHREAARRGAEWMVEVQDDDGAWRKDLSVKVLTPVNTYNARSAWGLALAGRTFGESGWVEAARRNGEWVLTQQNEAGWWASCEMDDGAPFLHGICYVTEGMIELGVLTERPDFVDSSRKACDVLLGIYERDGRIAGRLDARWGATVGWRCLTGEAQLALSWLRLYEITGEAGYLDAARRLNRDVVRTCTPRDRRAWSRGGVKGSQPVWGGYLSLAYSNWATKFLLDSLMLEQRLTS